jgi:hypothetical protein
MRRIFGSLVAVFYLSAACSSKEFSGDVGVRQSIKSPKKNSGNLEGSTPNPGKDLKLPPAHDGPIDLIAEANAFPTSNHLQPQWKIKFSWASGSAVDGRYQVAYQEQNVPPADCNSGTVIPAAIQGSRTNTDWINVAHNYQIPTAISVRVCTVNSVGDLSQGSVLRCQATLNSNGVGRVGMGNMSYACYFADLLVEVEKHQDPNSLDCRPDRAYCFSELLCNPNNPPETRTCDLPNQSSGIQTRSCVVNRDYWAREHASYSDWSACLSSK